MGGTCNEVGESNRKSVGALGCRLAFMHDSRDLSNVPLMLGGMTYPCMQVRWNTDDESAGTSPLGASSALCPNECWGRGNCSDSYDPMAESSSTVFNPGRIQPTADFQCNCKPGVEGQRSGWVDE